MSPKLRLRYELLASDDPEQEAVSLFGYLRWRNGVLCPRCGYGRVSILHKQAKFECVRCEHQFSLTSGTILHKTRLPLSRWVAAWQAMCVTEGKITGHALATAIGVSYPTAWRMKKQLNSPASKSGWDWNMEAKK